MPSLLPLPSDLAAKGLDQRQTSSACRGKFWHPNCFFPPTLSLIPHFKQNFLGRNRNQNLNPSIPLLTLGMHDCVVIGLNQNVGQAKAVTRAKAQRRDLGQLMKKATKKRETSKIAGDLKR